jgi:AraC-like DNA-binding protein
MPVNAAQPVQRSVFSSRDPEETTEFFRQVYVGNRTSFRHVAPKGGFAAQFAGSSTLRADRLSGALGMDITADALGYVLFGQLQHGRWTLRSGDHEMRLGPGDNVLYPVVAPFRLEAQDFDFRVVSLPVGRVGALAAEYTGIDPADLRFDSMSAVSPAMARHFSHTLALLQRELTEPDSAAANPLVAEQLIQTAAALTLTVFPNTAMTAGQLPAPGYVPPAAVRRATAFIDEHADEPITLSQIATAAGVKPRTLQAGFARHHDTSPMGYLRRVRLEGAHRNLQAADPTDGATVAGIAARWGFTNPGRFSTRYRQTYGQTPGHTLRT